MNKKIAKSNQDIRPRGGEQLWNAWYESRKVMLHELRIPADALIDYPHFCDFVFNYSDIYNIPEYAIDALADNEIICLYKILESFFACFHQVANISSGYTEKTVLDVRLDSMLLRDILIRYGYDLYCEEIPDYFHFVENVTKENKSFQDILPRSEEYLWDNWYRSHKLMTQKSRIPAEVLGNYSHFCDFVFDYSD